MVVSLVLKSVLKKYSKEKEIISFELKNNAKISDLILLSKIPTEEIGLILLNGKRKKIDATLKDGDEVIFYPLVGGG